ncbi:hypothetical protein ES703_15766 [subsurface metagenome]
MKRKRASEIFGQVDPGLKVIGGGTRHHNAKRRAKKLAEITGPPPELYNPKPSTLEDFEAAAGIQCPICHQETLRFFLTPWGEQVCPRCVNDPVCPHVKRSKHADMLIASGIRVCRLCLKA